MAFFTDPATYSNTILSDGMTGTPDYWTDGNGGTHSYASSQLTFTDNSASSEYISASASSSNAKKLIQITWKWTSGSSTPIIFQYVNNTTSFQMGVGCYINFTTNIIYARNGAAWTSTSQTLATNTFQDLEFVVDEDTDTYKLYMNASLIGTYSVDTTGGGTYGNVLMGGGSSAAQEVYVFSKILVKDTLATSAIKTINGLAKASVKTINGLAIASVKTKNGLV